LPLLAAACGASPDPNYYTIVPRNGPTFPGGPKIILLKESGWQAISTAARSCARRKATSST